MRGTGEEIKDFHIAALLLGGLPLVTALDARPDDELTLEYVKGKLLDKFNRISEKNDVESNHTALKSSNNQKKK